MEEIINNLMQLNPIWVYFTVFIIAYIENIFPPFPSDIVLIIAGSLSAIGRVDLYFVLIIATFGSTAGFMTMYKIGAWFGLKVIETNRFKFLQLDKIHNVERWFQKYGYFVVVINRFLAGTRAVISFFTGVSNLSFWKTSLLACISSLLWNTILLIGGNTLGANWHVIKNYLDTYWKVVTIISAIVVVLIIVINYYRKNGRKS